MRLSDSIEAFIKAMLESETEHLELKRNELAEYFHCAPSQINYVLATRFTPDHGYATESRRGGGGYIRIIRLTRAQGDPLLYLINERIGDAIDETSALALLSQMAESGVVPRSVAGVMAGAVGRQALSVPVPESVKNALRARVLRGMLIEVAKQRPHAAQAGGGL